MCHNGRIETFFGKTLFQLIEIDEKRYQVQVQLVEIGSKPKVEEAK